MNQPETSKFSFWEIQYTSCESNDRWTVARAPVNWDEYDVRARIPLGGCGDDVAQIEDVFETSNTEYYWDFVD